MISLTPRSYMLAPTAWMRTASCVLIGSSSAATSRQLRQQTGQGEYKQDCQGDTVVTEKKTNSHDNKQDSLTFFKPSTFQKAQLAVPLSGGRAHIQLLGGSTCNHLGTCRSKATLVVLPITGADKLGNLGHRQAHNIVTDSQPTYGESTSRPTVAPDRCPTLRPPQALHLILEGLHTQIHKGFANPLLAQVLATDPRRLQPLIISQSTTQAKWGKANIPLLFKDFLSCLT